MGLLFIEGFSATRIALALVLVLLSCVAIVLCWVLVGPVDGKAGDVGRVQTGFVMGILVFLAGCGGVAGGAVVSWVVM